MTDRSFRGGAAPTDTAPAVGAAAPRTDRVAQLRRQAPWEDDVSLVFDDPRHGRAYQLVKHYLETGRGGPQSVPSLPVPVCDLEELLEEIDDFATCLEQRENLAALIRRLAYVLRKTRPANPIPAQALAYLDRIGLSPNVLRKGE